MDVYLYGFAVKKSAVGYFKCLYEIAVGILVTYCLAAADDAERFNPSLASLVSHLISWMTHKDVVFP